MADTYESTYNSKQKKGAVRQVCDISMMDRSAVASGKMMSISLFSAKWKYFKFKSDEKSF